MQTIQQILRCAKAKSIILVLSTTMILSGCFRQVDVAKPNTCYQSINNQAFLINTVYAPLIKDGLDCDQQHSENEDLTIIKPPNNRLILSNIAQKINRHSIDTIKYNFIVLETGECVGARFVSSTIPLYDREIKSYEAELLKLQVNPSKKRKNPTCGTGTLIVKQY